MLLLAKFQVLQASQAGRQTSQDLVDAVLLHTNIAICIFDIMSKWIIVF